MNDDPLFISIGEEKLHYLRWGSGKRLLLAFHGYGNDALIFSPFKEYLADEYTILSFDLPHHGASEWPDGALLEKTNLFDLVRVLKETYKVDKISLAGYSMGGRVCMSIVENMPESIDKVALIATDGLVINKLYYFCTRTYIGRKIFKHMVNRPERYFRLIEWLKRTNRIDSGRYKFVMHYLQSAAQRKYLFRVWMSMSDLIPKPRNLKRVIKQYRIPVFIFMGAYDRIMPVSLGERFREGLDSVQLIILEKGHRVFDDENAGQIAKSLL